jgi:hypothetical protein
MMPSFGNRGDAIAYINNGVDKGWLWQLCSDSIVFAGVPGSASRSKAKFMRQSYARASEIDRIISNFDGDVEGAVQRAKPLIAQLYGYTGDLARLGSGAWKGGHEPVGPEGHRSDSLAQPRRLGDEPRALLLSPPSEQDLP